MNRFKMEKQDNKSKGVRQKDLQTNPD